MWTCDPRTLRFLRVNGAAVARYGYSRCEFLNMTLADLCPQDDREAFCQRFPYVKSLVPTTVRHVLRNGLVIDVEIMREVAELDGTAVWLAAARDVTAYLDLERQLKHQALYDELTALPNGALFVDRLEHSLRNLEVARRVLRSLDEPFLLPGAPGVSVSASIGIAMPKVVRVPVSCSATRTSPCTSPKAREGIAR